MKRIHTLILALTAVAGSAMGQTLSVTPIEAEVGTETTLEVSVSGASANTTALQFNLTLPEGVSLNQSGIAQGTAASGHTLEVRTLESGDLLFVLYSMNLTAITDGTLLSLPVTLPSEAGTLTGRLGTVRCADTDGVSHTLDDAQFTITATEAYTPEFAYQKYVVRNVGSGLYWGAGNDWGTRASLVAYPEYLKLKPLEGEGQYQMESQVNNGGEQYYFNGDYMDNGTPLTLQLTRQDDGTYTIGNGTVLYGYDGSTTVLGKTLTDATDPNARWTITALSDMPATLEGATVENPADATFYIEDHNFGRNNRYYSKWTWEFADAGNTNHNNSGDDTNFCVESYHAQFSITQSVTGAPSGVYALRAQGFYRQDGTDSEHLPEFFLNGATATFPAHTGSESSMSAASLSFSAGNYMASPVVVRVDDGNLTFGARLAGNTNLWCIFDNFTLTYYGDTTVEAVEEVLNAGEQAAELAAAQSELEALLAYAATLTDAIADETLDGVRSAASAATESTKLEEVEEATTSVKSGIATFKTTYATEVLTNAEPISNLDGWTVANQSGNPTFDAGNHCAEYWNQTFDFSQSVTLPAGNYLLEVRAFAREGADAIEVYAGDQAVELLQLSPSVVNNRGQAGAWFTASELNGINRIAFTLTESTEVAIGLRNAHTTTDGWTVWNSFTLLSNATFPTAIEGIGADKSAAATYDLSGRRVNARRLHKGLYIVNGKKVVRF